jgi:hypothetical protein
LLIFLSLPKFSDLIVLLVKLKACFLLHVTHE